MTDVDEAKPRIEVERSSSHRPSEKASVTSKYSVELFMEACSASGPLHLSVEDKNRPGPVRRVFHQPFVIIGRDPMTDLLLDHRRVSRRHTYLQLVMGRLFCIDLGSRTGTLWDDGSNQSGWLDAGRTIVVGPYEIGQWSDGQPAQERHDVPWQAGIVDEEPSLDSYAIDFLTQPERESPINLGQNLVLVGRSEECLVRLPFSDVSKAHCSLLKSPLGVWVVDLLGRGGIFVNETHVRFARLDDGDELRIGRHLLRFQVDEARPRPQPASSPSRALARRAAETPPAPWPERAALPSSGVSMVPVWHYPDTNIQTTLNDRESSQVEMVQALMQPMVQQFSLMQRQMFEQFHQAMMGMFQSFGAAHREQMSDFRDELDEVRRLTQELQELQKQAASRNEEAAIARTVPTRTESVAENGPSPSSTLKSGSAPETSLPEEPTFRRPPTKSDAGVHSILFDRIATLQDERQSRWQRILAKMNNSSQ